MSTWDAVGRVVSAVAVTWLLALAALGLVGLVLAIRDLARGW